MMSVPLVRQLVEAGSIRKFLTDYIGVGYTDEDRLKVIEKFVRIRHRHDFCFWAAMLVYIKTKDGGEDIRFWLNRPQRRLITRFEKKRLAGLPIRLILLKARQWGGSTATQIYMAWLQITQKVGLNSLIVGQQKDASFEVKDMFDKMIDSYPLKYLHEMGESFKENESKTVAVGKTGNITRLIQRNAKIKIGSYEKPNSARGGSYNLVHCTEVGLWEPTEKKSPEKITRSATAGILLRPLTMIVYESTANGTGNFFQIEYDAAKAGESQFEALFIAWFDIDQYTLPIENVKEFAEWLYSNRNNKNVRTNREECGAYLWSLWEKGATLEAIRWYIEERKKYTDHGDMASEYPSDDVEAFVHSGARVFDKYAVDALKPACKIPPQFIGDILGDGRKGKKALDNVRFEEDHQGLFWIWSKPEIDEDEQVKDRYLVSVDIGGRSKNADYSVICVFDRIYMMDGGRPSVVAQWYGHIDMDILAWKAAQVAKYYDNALLVIESNTLETKDKERDVDNDQSTFILNKVKKVYDNLYARAQSAEDIAEGVPKKYGFHTNVSTKPMIISGLIEYIRDRMYTERDQRCLNEYLCYEKKQNGAFGAIVGKHDDLLMSRAIGLHICFNEMPVPKIVKKTKVEEFRKVQRRRRKQATAATIS